MATLSVVAGCGWLAAAPGAAASEAPGAAASELVVQFEGRPPGWALARASPGPVRDINARAGFVTIPGGPALARRVRGLPGVVGVEPNRVYRVAAVPNDPLLTSQWQLIDPDHIGAPAAWRRSNGAGAVVAVLDTGIELAHPDLSPSLWHNAGEVPGNGLDDDRNGLADDVHGYDFVGYQGAPVDRHGHGTSVAGIAAARGDNGLGIAGVAWRGRVMAVKVVDDRGAGHSARIAAGISYATRMGARVINLSVAGVERSEILADAVHRAREAGIVVVASAGNERLDLDSVPVYPAAQEGVIAVAASDRHGRLAGFSNRGDRTVELAAPGQAIRTTALGGAYTAIDGTSAAAPHGAGTVALLAAARPDLSGAQLEDALLQSAQPRVDGVAYGRLDAAGALRALLGPEPEWSETVRLNWPGSRPRPQLRLRSPRRGARVRSGRVRLEWRVRASSGIRRQVVSVDGRRLSFRPAGTVGRVSVRLGPGRHVWRVSAVDRAGQRRSLGSWFRVERR